MKLFLRIFLVSVFAVFLAGNAMAVPFTTFSDGGAGLQNVLNGIATDGVSDIDVTTDSIADELDSTWGITASGGSVATFIIEIAGFAGTNTFGVYDNGKYVEIFSGTDTAGAQKTLSLHSDGTVYVNNVKQTDGSGDILFTGNSFGYYVDSSSQDGGILAHSDTSLNSDGVDHMLAFQGVGENTKLPGFYAAEWTPNEWVLAFEDLFQPGSDYEFTDLVVMVESVKPIPEPATMFLFGFGLLGLASLARKKTA